MAGQKKPLGAQWEVWITYKIVKAGVCLCVCEELSGRVLQKFGTRDQLLYEDNRIERHFCSALEVASHVTTGHCGVCHSSVFIMG